MRDINEVLKDERVINIWRNVQNDKAIQVKLDVYCKEYNKTALVKFTRAIGWEHLCASFTDETPSWDTMHELKQMFWEDTECTMQLHPKSEDYINNHEHCLHIWRPVDIEIPTPPTLLVGFKEGNEEEDRKNLKIMQEELGSPLSDKQIDLMVMATKNKDKLDSELKKMSINDIIKLMQMG